MKIKDKSWYPWLVVGLLWGVALLNYLDRQMLSTMRESIALDISELDRAENFGRLMAVFLWIYGILSPMAGLIADRVSRKWLIILSLFVWSGVTLAMGYTHNFGQLYILRAIMGVSEALYIPAGLSMIADYHRGNTRSLAVGIHMTGLYVGQAMGGFGATVAHKWSWQFTFHSFGLIGIIYSIFLFALLYEPRTPSIKIANKPGTAPAFSGIRHSLSLLLGTVSFWALLYYFAAPSFPGWAVKNWLPTLFSNTLGIDMSEAGPISTITIAVSLLAGVLSGGALSDKWIRYNLRGRIYTGAIGVSLLIPALLLLGFSSSITGIMTGGILFGIGFGMFDANNMPILCQFISPRHRAAGYGLMNMTGVFAGALITQVLGKSTDAGHLGRDMAILTIPVAIAVILQLLMLKPTVADMTEDPEK